MSSPFRQGESLSASKLNAHSAAMAQASFTGGNGYVDKVGQNLSINLEDDSYYGLWVRLYESQEVTDDPIASGRSVYRHSWEAIRLDENEGNWVRDKTRWGIKEQEPVYAPDFSLLTLTPDSTFDDPQTTGITPYFVTKDPVSQKLFAIAGGGGKLDTSGKDIQLMLLGSWDEYKDCSGVPPKPPTQTANGTDFCWPPYAWSAYKVCGYKYKKLFDMRSYGKWALELNGGGAPAYRRFYPAIWGWDTYTGGKPQSSDACAGVRFLGFSSQSTLVCTCPTWLSDTKCFKLTVKFKNQADVPCDPDSANCPCTNQFWADMADYWGQTVDIVLCEDGSCVWQGGDSPFSYTLNYQEIPRGGNECFWGPDEFDPCNPCDGFGRFALSVNRGYHIGGNAMNFYSGYKVKMDAIHGLVQDCSKGPIELGQSDFWSPCPNVIDSVKISCCSSSESANCIATSGGGGGGGGPTP